MNDAMFDRAWADHDRATAQARVSDAAGMVWGHPNPVELYRWVSRRNDLLRTIAEAIPHGAPRAPVVC